MPGVEQQIYRGAGGVSPAAALPEASGAAFGTGIGDAIAGAGNELEESSLRAMRAERARQDESENAQAAVAAAQLHTQINQARIDARDQAPDDGAGHVQNVSNVADSMIGNFLGSIKDPKLRQKWAAQAAEMKAGMVDDEEVWARSQRITSIGNNAAEAQRLWGNTLQTTPTPDAFQSALKAGETFWNNANVPQNVRDKGNREFGANAAENFASGLIESAPDQAKQLLTSGGLDSWLDPNKKRELVSRADTQLRILDADQRRKADVLKAQAVTDAHGLTQQIDQGVVVPDDQLAGVVGRLKAYGLDNQAEELQYQEGKLKLSRVTDHWTPADFTKAIDPLAAKVAQGQASPDEQRQLKILTELAPAKIARFKDNPDAAAAASGINPPQVDLSAPDPNAVQARIAWAKSFANTAHVPDAPYLNKDQLEQYRQKVAEGPVSELDAATELKNTWGAPAAASIVRQIGGAPASDMKIMLGLDPGVAQIYRQGHEALAKGAVQLDDNAARQVWGQAMKGVPSDLGPSLFDTARKIAAGWMERQGFTKPPANFADVFNGALQYAAGRRGDPRDFNSPGGLAQLNGRYAWLPSDMSSNDFLSRVARAQPHDWVNAATDPRGNPVQSAPHYMGPDGRPKPYTVGDALNFSKGTLQTVDAGLYHLIDRMGHTVVDERGRPWTFDVRRLGAR